MFKIGDPSGVSNVAARRGEITVLPNPTYGPVAVESDVEGSRILVHDLAGRCVIDAAATTNVDLSAYPAGIYILTAITADGNTAVEKIIKR